LGGVTAYAVFGTSRQLNTGPSAIVAVLSASVIASLTTLGSPQWLTYTAALALMSGIIFATFGILRMGWISYFLSRAVMGGFVFGFGIALIINQSFKIFGVPEAGGTYFLRFIGMIKAIPYANPYTFAVGATSIVLLTLMRRYLPKWPRALIVVVLSIIAAPALGLAAYGVKVVGTLPTGLPKLGLPSITVSTLGTLVLGGLAVFFVGLSESLAAAREMSEKHDYSINPSQEMIAQGAANGVSGLLGGFVVGGSLSKTNVADNAGQKTQLGSLFTGLFLSLIHI
jgi:MFS superfamily sulfate permease-like transporter